MGHSNVRLNIVISLCRERSVYLTVPQMIEIHEHMKTSYEMWIADAPESYRRDDFFTSRRPVAVTSRYGQNQQIGGSELNGEMEDRNWEIDRPWNQISHVTAAVATHIWYGFSLFNSQ